MTLCESCQKKFPDAPGGSVCSHDDGNARAHGNGHARAHGNGNAYAYGNGNARAYGNGNAYAYGDGYARAYGDGTETDSRGTRTNLECIDGYPTKAGNGWLRVGCELRTYEDWVENADAIDEKHGDGLADQTRALAQRLMEEN